MDPLTDVFMSMRVESVIYKRLEATAPWGLSFEAPGPAKFGMVMRGNCWITVDGEPRPIPLTAGDCYVLPRGSAHTLRDHPRARTRQFAEVLDCSRGDVIHYGGGGAPTTIIGGKFIFDGSCGRPLTDLLPPIIHVKADDSRAVSLRTILHLLASEIQSPAPGSQVVISRLADVLFVQAIRTHVASNGCCRTGWLKALADPAIEAALKCMHEKIDHPWTVAELASAAGMSRSAFALRFKELVGETPLEYLTRWRMHQASRWLRDGKAKLLEVAKQVGYDSDGAFNKAFKRVLGVTPGEFRRNGRPGMFPEPPIEMHGGASS